MTTWKKLITIALKENNESWKDVISHTFSEEELNTKFDDGFGLIEGCCFTLWTKERVYFPAHYDGSEWVESASRNPNGCATHHIGG